MFRVSPKKLPEIKSKRGLNRNNSSASIGTTSTDALMQNLKNHLIGKDRSSKKFHSARSIDNHHANANIESANLAAIEEIDSMQ